MRGDVVVDGWIETSTYSLMFIRTVLGISCSISMRYSTFTRGSVPQSEIREPPSKESCWKFKRNKLAKLILILKDKVELQSQNVIENYLITIIRCQLLLLYNSLLFVTIFFNFLKKSCYFYVFRGLRIFVHWKDQRPDRLWGPLSLLANVNRGLFPREG
jgi:hypothetical protein